MMDIMSMVSDGFKQVYGYIKAIPLALVAFILSLIICYILLHIFGGRKERR